MNEEKVKATKAAPIIWIEVTGDIYPDEIAVCLWCKVPICEPPYCGTMLDCDFTPNYYTHFAVLLNEHFPEPNKKD